jgi:hypothetical protein
LGSRFVSLGANVSTSDGMSRVMMISGVLVGMSGESLKIVEEIYHSKLYRRLICILIFSFGPAEIATFTG